MRQLALYVTLLLLLAACTDGQQMRRQLAELQARNQADSLLTDDSLALALTDYFDRHGTANEQMLAHYLLGRTYDDMGEAPAALSAFQDAADRADTASTDCDYYTLSRVYAQMSHVFYRQNLMDDYLRCLNHSTAYALAANDTIMALQEYALKMLAYDRLRQYDSTMIVCDAVYDRFCSIGQRQLGAQHVGGAIMSFLLKGHLEKAKKYIDIYEAESGYFDSCHQISKGREIYYFIKGTYYLHTHQYDSAEYLFRKELREGTDFNNQNSAASGLSELFEKRNLPDSAAKYARYSYAMNDSVYAQMSTSEVERLQAMYNYTNHQKRAQMEKEKGDEARQQVRFLLYIIIGVVIVSIFLFYRWRQKQRTELLKYRQLLGMLERAQTELIRLQSHEVELQDSISEKQVEVEQLQSAILQIPSVSWNAKASSGDIWLKNSPTYTAIHKKALTGERLTETEWHDIDRLITERIPEFHQFISEHATQHGLTAFQTCALLRLHLRTKDVGNMLGVSSAYISKICTKMVSDFWGVKGSSKELREHLEALS